MSTSEAYPRSPVAREPRAPLQDRGDRAAQHGPGRGGPGAHRAHPAPRQAARDRQGDPADALPPRRRARAVQRRPPRAGRGTDLRRGDPGGARGSAPGPARRPPFHGGGLVPGRAGRPLLRGVGRVAPGVRAARPGAGRARRGTGRGLARGGDPLVRAASARRHGLPAGAGAVPRLRDRHRAGGERVLARGGRRAGPGVRARRARCTPGLGRLRSRCSVTCSDRA